MNVKIPQKLGGIIEMRGEVISPMLLVFIPVCLIVN